MCLTVMQKGDQGNWMRVSTDFYMNHTRKNRKRRCACQQLRVLKEDDISEIGGII